jgi:hypothetical protein
MEQADEDCACAGPPDGRLRGNPAPPLARPLAARGRRGRRDPLLPERGGAAAGAGAVPRDSLRGGPRRPRPAHRRRPGGGPGEPAARRGIHPFPAGPVLLRAVLPRGARRRGCGGRHRDGTAGRRGGHQLRAGAGRRQQPPEPGHRRPGALGRPRGGRPPRSRLPARLARRRRPPRGEAFPRPRGDEQRLPRGVAGRPQRVGDPRGPGSPSVPRRRPRRDSSPHDGARPVPRAGPGTPGDLLREDPRPAAPETDAVSRSRVLRRARDGRRRLPARCGRGRGPGRLGGVRHRPALPGRGGAAGGRRGAGEGVPGQPEVPRRGVGV